MAESGRLIFDTEIPNIQQKIDDFSSSYRRSLISLRDTSQQNAQYQGEIYTSFTWNLSDKLGV